MKTIEFKRLVVQSDVILREVEQRVKRCRHCQSDELRSAGSKGGQKRFKCSGCSKTFNAYTGTTLARLRMPEKHIEHAQLMVEGLTIRKVAKALGIDLQTAFLWRHRFLQTARDDQPGKLAGVVEADETFFLESFKGQKSGLPSPSKTRGAPDKQIGSRLVTLLGKDVVQCSDGASAYRTLGKLHGLDVKSLPGKKAAGNYHINNVNAYDRRPAQIMG